LGKFSGSASTSGSAPNAEGCDITIVLLARGPASRGSAGADTTAQPPAIFPAAAGACDVRSGGTSTSEAMTPLDTPPSGADPAPPTDLIPLDTLPSDADLAQLVGFFTAQAYLDTLTCDASHTDGDPALTLPINTAPLDTPTSGADSKHLLGTVTDPLDPSASDKDTSHLPTSDQVYLSFSSQDTDSAWQTPLKYPAYLDSPYQDPVPAH